MAGELAELQALCRNLERKFVNARQELKDAENEAAAWQEVALSLLPAEAREMYEELDWEWKGNSRDLFDLVQRLALPKGATL